MPLRKVHLCRPVVSDGARAKPARLIAGAASGAGGGEVYAKRQGKLKRSG
jgi:hypothetical protein